MSLTDPAKRLRRNPRFLLLVDRGLLVLTALTGFATGFSTALLADGSAPDALGVLLTVGMLLVICAPIGWVFVRNWRTSAGPDQPASPIVLVMLGMYALFPGLGLLAATLGVGGAGITGLVLAVAGGALLLAAAWARSRARSEGETAAGRAGHVVRTTGRVTDVRFVGHTDYTPSYRIVVRFADAAGRERWITTTHDRDVAVGSTVPVRFDPADPARRSTTEAVLP